MTKYYLKTNPHDLLKLGFRELNKINPEATKTIFVKNGEHIILDEITKEIKGVRGVNVMELAKAPTKSIDIFGYLNNVGKEDKLIAAWNKIIKLEKLVELYKRLLIAAEKRNEIYYTIDMVKTQTQIENLEKELENE